ncbi:MAG: phosphatase PAP2 family protein [Streptosporangiaceae bacterium]
MLAGSACLVLAAAVYGLAVWTPTGQRFEDAVLQAADGSPHRTGALSLLSPWTMVAALALVASAGLRRGGRPAACAAAAIAVGPVLTARLLRRLLVRPALFDPGPRHRHILDAVDHQQNQSFPSGHTAAALGVMCALVLVTPHRFRPVVFALTSAAVGVGALSVTAGMHRPSDTVGSGCLVLAWLCAALVLLGRRSALLRVGRGPGHLLVAGFLAAGASAGAVLGSIAGARTMIQVRAAPDPQLLVSPDALVAGQALALSGGLLVLLCLFVLLGGLDLRRPR